MPTLGQPVCKTAERDNESSYSSRMDAMAIKLWISDLGLSVVLDLHAVLPQRLIDPENLLKTLRPFSLSL